PPIRALGSEYAAASYRDRYEGLTEEHRWHVFGVVDGTTLTYDPPIPGAPSTLDRSEVQEFVSDKQFVVQSQGSDHPFLMLTYMSSSYALADVAIKTGYPGAAAIGGVGDSDCVRVVAGEQYLRRYVFFTDPTYPETNLVIVRRRGKTGFADVNLDCAG